MKSSLSHLKIRISSNHKSSPHSSPKLQSRHPMLSAISEQTSMKYPSTKETKTTDTNSNNHHHRHHQHQHQQQQQQQYENEYDPSTVTPCNGYDTPAPDTPHHDYPDYNVHGEEEEEIQSPLTPVTPQQYPPRRRNKTNSNKKGHFTMTDSESKAIDDNLYHEQKAKQFLRSKGYHSFSKIASTLQGAIYKAKCCVNESNDDIKEPQSHNHNNNPNVASKSVVIKVTEKRWHEKSVAFVEGQEIPIKENIVDEIKILRWLTIHEPPPAITRFIAYHQDESNIYLVMEDGGMDFFKFVAECHKLINSGLLSIQEWQSAVRALFKQMIEFVDWMHTKMAVCHLDISLENLLITDVFVMSEQVNGAQQIYLSHNFQVKFCDFGLSTAFDGKDFRCNKYVGKTGYKAPKVYGKKKIFDARAADIWSLGIVLFMMCIGAPPFKRPSKKEYAFELIMSGRMGELIESWGRMNYLTKPMFDLLGKMLQREEKRITMSELRRHPWIALP